MNTKSEPQEKHISERHVELLVIIEKEIVKLHEGEEGRIVVHREVDEQERPEVYLLFPSDFKLEIWNDLGGNTDYWRSGALRRSGKPPVKVITWGKYKIDSCKPYVDSGRHVFFDYTHSINGIEDALLNVVGSISQQAGSEFDGNLHQHIDDFTEVIYEIAKIAASVSENEIRPEVGKGKGPIFMLEIKRYQDFLGTRLYIPQWSRRLQKGTFDFYGGPIVVDVENPLKSYATTLEIMLTGARNHFKTS